MGERFAFQLLLVEFSPGVWHPPDQNQVRRNAEKVRATTNPFSYVLEIPTRTKKKSLILEDLFLLLLRDLIFYEIIVLDITRDLISTNKGTNSKFQNCLCSVF